MIRVATTLLVAGFVAACAWQSEVQKVGDDLYELSTSASRGKGGVAGARTTAVNDATRHCESLGKRIDVMDVETQHTFPASGFATVKFSCR